MWFRAPVPVVLLHVLLMVRSMTSMDPGFNQRVVNNVMDLGVVTMVGGRSILVVGRRFFRSNQKNRLNLIYF